ncbi:unnamed protein product [Sphagnum troendelagicum]|uniref:Uncharacterized protein n=1 Tax=Sphagnum troendelagicum TaxID=128251 RepID=A0ABP0U6Z0_9BRYO
MCKRSMSSSPSSARLFSVSLYVEEGGARRSNGDVGACQDEGGARRSNGDVGERQVLTSAYLEESVQFLRMNINDRGSKRDICDGVIAAGIMYQ